MTVLEVRESEIEDVLAQYPALLKQILGVPNELRLLARQLPLPSGRLDLIYSHLAQLLLIELKVEPFRPTYVNQVVQYRSDLLSLQKSGRFVGGPLTALVLCPELTPSDQHLASQQGVELVLYRPADVLKEFYK